MITAKKVLLITSNENVVSELRKFEAICEVKSETLKEKVWALNKTPVFLTNKNASELDDAVAIPFRKIEPENFTKWCYNIGFEPGEYSTGAKFDTREEPCILCSLVGHKAISTDTGIYNSETKEPMTIFSYWLFKILK